MPLASMSNVTSILGTPRGAGMMPSRWNLPSVRLYLRLGALALEDVHLDARLAVGRRREDLLLLRRDGRVARDHRRHHAAQRLDAERQRRDVEEHHVLHVAGEHARLHRRADARRPRPGSRPCAAPCRRTSSPSPAPAGCASSRRRARPRRCPSAASSRRRAPSCTGSIERSTSGADHLLELRARQAHVEVHRAARADGEERQVDAVSCTLESSIFAFSAASLQALEGHLVLARRRCRSPS